MKTLFIALIASIFMCSCYKDEFLVPRVNDLTGVWVADDWSLQLTIHNTDGKGSKYVTFKDVTDETGRWLIMNMEGVVTRYKIEFKEGNKMILVESGTKSYNLTKIKDW